MEIARPQALPQSQQQAIAWSKGRSYAVQVVRNVVPLLAAEGLALSASLLLASGMRQALAGEPSGYIGYGWGVVPMYVAIAWGARLIPGWGLGAVEEFRRVVLTLLGAFALTATGLWLAHVNVGSVVSSRLTLIAGGAVALLLVPMARWGIKSAMTRRDLWGVPAVVYGAGVAGARIVRQLQEERGIGYRPAAVFNDDLDAWGGYLDTIPIVGDTSQIDAEAPVAFLALPESESNRQIDLLEGPLAGYRTVVIIPDLFDAPSLWVTPRDFAGVLGLELTSTLTRWVPRLLKRTGELLVVLPLALVWGPLVAALAALVWLEDRAWPFYAQSRVGQDGRTIRTWKLRTMVPEADAVLDRALDADPALKAEWDAHFKLEHDPRITRIGRVLRRTSLDELPQLFNVLVGDMSLVGPRPLPEYHHRELPARVRVLRERVRPGITGLWQVSGRSDSGNVGMERWDPYYVRNWSPWLDAVILVRTLRVVIRGSGAY
ncbi:MAG: exopolysaccharide biosynthesis polyprenyl glycosylphosphotransferase [Bacteroidota bacterium]